MSDFADFQLLIKSRTPLVVIETTEEARAIAMVEHAGRDMKRMVFQWTATRGLEVAGSAPLSLVDHQAMGEQSEAAEPEELLAKIRANKKPSVYILCDFHPYLQDEPVLVRRLKDVAQASISSQHTLVFISHALNLPQELQAFSARLSLPFPSEAELRQIIREEIMDWAQAHAGQRVRGSEQTLNTLLRCLAGLTHADARRLARTAIYDDGAITDSDIPEVNRAKFELMNMDGILHFEYDLKSPKDVGGLERLKKWLDIRRSAFQGEASDFLDTPKGVLLLGVQGGGKSLAARAVAGSWQLPLLRMDAGALYNKFHGETEKNVRETLRMADAMAPCILWIDEIEKSFAQEGHDNGTSQRVLGTLLTWMAERKTRVFMVATANDISRLPPELLRKGRFDEIFFVDLPSPQARQEIFRIHLSQRKLDASTFNLAALADASSGFTGAEIEQAVVAARYSAYANRAFPATPELLAELHNTRPLSVTMAEQMQALRAWAQERAVSAD